MDRPPLALVLVYGLLLIFVCVLVLIGVVAFGLLLFGIAAHGDGSFTVHMSG